MEAPTKKIKLDELAKQKLCGLAGRVNAVQESQLIYRTMLSAFTSTLDTLERDLFGLCKRETIQQSPTPTSIYSGSVASPLSTYKTESDEDTVVVKTECGLQDCAATATKFPYFVYEADPAIVFLGPNYTQILAADFLNISWSNAAFATRMLLGYIFTHEELATHTLTGKPSPAFYGRERPSKLQLNSRKIADVIHCICVQCGCKERDVRAAITAKCADATKQYRRLSEKNNTELKLSFD